MYIKKEGMIYLENYLEIIEKVLKHNLVKSAIVIIVAILIYRFFSMILLRSEKKRGKRNIGQKDKTFLRMIRNFMKYAFAIIVLLMVLQINGIDVSSMIAGVGVLSIIIGFIVQDAFKDIIRGIDIISDNYFAVGDVVKYGEIEGKVLMVGLKTTKIEDIKTFNIISIANRNIEQVEIVSHDVNIDIPLPYDVKLANAEKAINDIIERIKNNPNVEDCLYMGVNNFNDSSISYMIRVKVDPKEKLQVRRDSLRTILDTLSKHKIEIPFQQIDIHTK